MIKILHQRARQALLKSYAPYSNFCVGAAILCSDGTVITAGNVEFAVSAIGMCAERLALSEVRMRRLFPTHIAICSHYNNKITFDTSSCGLCRQAMCEFDKLKIFKSKGNYISVKTLLPKAFQGRKPK